MKSNKSCQIENINNGKCDSECNNELCSFDWGDCSEYCDPSNKCKWDMLGNG